MIAKRVVIAYALLGAAWILLSDQLLELVFGLRTNAPTSAQIGKAWLFVGLTALSFYLLLRHMTQRFRSVHRELTEVQDRLSDFLEAGSDWQCEMGPDLRFTGFSERFRQVTGIDPATLVGRRRDDPATARAAGHLPFRDVTYPLVDSRGHITYARVSGKPVFDAAGAFQGYRGIGTDVTAAVEAQETQARLAAILQVTPDVVATADAEGRVLFLNSAGRRLKGLHPEGALAGLMLTELLAKATAESLDRVILPAAARDGVWSGESQLGAANGKELPALLTVLAHKRIDGTVTYYSLVARDLSERQETEARFARSRRLEAVGQLSAGVAHDFNNLLLVILGNAEILEGGHQNDPRLRQAVGLIRQASGRAAELTERLLTFARQRSLKPQPVRLDRLVGDMLSLLQRSLGEAVQVQVDLDPSLGPVFVDRSELETTLLNLAINARDAMPRGGQLTIEAQNVDFDADANGPRELAPGNYVMIAVSDTGAGMSRETLERVFEPFFTTKDPGRGTGLGLPMAFGFARQSGGHLAIYSELDCGTTVRLYLPRHKEEAPLRQALAPVETAPAPGGSERVLLVEDEPLVRQFVETQLSTLGYRVVSASNGEEAMHALRSDLAFDLLLTDIVMPGKMKGPEIAAEARRQTPTIKVIYTTGYAQQAAFAHAGVPADAPVLSKPYRRATLARLLRSVLEPARQRQTA
jgi:PAS domain S-box-containing protein